MLVCDPRRNALLKEGNKSDKIDARKLADLLRTGNGAGRSITGNTDCERCANWGAVIRRSAKI